MKTVIVTNFLVKLTKFKAQNDCEEVMHKFDFGFITQIKIHSTPLVPTATFFLGFINEWVKSNSGVCWFLIITYAFTSLLIR